MTMMDATLTEAERGLIVRMFGPGCNILSSTVARLYVAPPNGIVWKFANIIGALAVMNDKNMKGHFLRMIDIKSMKITFEQEIYEHFEYKNPRAWFHTFESDNVVHGFSFANELEAKSFFDSVNHVVSSISPGPPPSMPAQLTTQRSFTTSIVTTTNNPAANPTNPTTPAPASAYAAANTSSNNLTTADKKKKKKLFGKKKKEDEHFFEISGPTGFKHESHIGWDAKKGFEIRNIPPEWKKLFQQAGIRKSEMRDAETASLMINIVSNSLAGNMPPPPPGAPVPGMPPPVAGAPRPNPQMPPPQQYHNPPPPPPSMSGPPPPMNYPPPPPPSMGPPLMNHPPPGPPPMAMGRAAPAAPPPPPAAGGGPPPPPPPPPMAKTPSMSSMGGGGGGDYAPPPAPPTPPAGGGGGNNSRTDLLAAIRGGAQLRKVDPASLPDISTIPESQSASIVDTLANAIKARRVNIHVEEDEPEDDWDDDDDEWSD